MDSFDPNLENLTFPSVKMSTPASFNYASFSFGALLLIFQQSVSELRSLTSLYLNPRVIIAPWVVQMLVTTQHLQQHVSRFFATIQQLGSCSLIEVAPCIFMTLIFCVFNQVYEQIVTSSFYSIQFFWHLFELGQREFE